MPLPAEAWIGTAGWSLPKDHASRFPATGSHLERYAARFNAVEINSSFYRPHRPATYARWAASVPEGHRFAVKVPKEITHTRRLRDPAEPLERFLAEAGALGEKLGPLLVQLPPKLHFDAGLAAAFFGELRRRFDGHVVCEPRHPTWFTDEVDAFLVHHHVARVAADPSVVPRAAEPGGWPGLAYRRLHGAPKVYYSAYPPDRLQDVAVQIVAGWAAGRVEWCIFDNTALGEATRDALTVLASVRPSSAP